MSLGEHLQHYCRFCGTRRIGAFRYCRTCRFDFDAGARLPDAAAVVEVSVPVVVLAGSGGSVPGRGLLAIAFIVVLGFAGLSSIAPNPESPTAALSVAAATSTPGSENLVAGAPSATTGPEARSDATPPDATGPAAAPPASASTVEPLALGPTGTLTRARVVDVIDGATIVVAFGGVEHTVRYLGADVPGTVTSGSNAALASQALAANESLVAGTTVVLEQDVTDTDRSGRLLRYVWLKKGSTWTLVNLELVRRGFAAVATHPPDTKYTDMYKTAERHARARGLGVWAKSQPAEPKPKPKPRPTSKPETSAR